jgi:hypothetical protein
MYLECAWTDRDIFPGYPLAGRQEFWLARGLMLAEIDSGPRLFRIQYSRLPQPQYGDRSQPVKAPLDKMCPRTVVCPKTLLARKYARPHASSTATPLVSS